MAIDSTPYGDFCVRAADPAKGEGTGRRYEYIGTDRGYTILKDDTPEQAEKIKKAFLGSRVPR